MHCETAYAVLQFELPSGRLCPIAVLILDPLADRVYIRVGNDFAQVPEEERPIVQLLLAQLEQDVAAESGTSMLARMENSLSNTIQISDLKPFPITDLDTGLDQLFTEHLGHQSKAATAP